MKRKAIVLIAIFLLAIVAFAEKTIDQQIADLEKKLSTIPGKEKVGILNELAHECKGQYPERCIKYAHQALALSQKLNDPGGEAAALREIGEHYRLMGDCKKALEYAEKSLEICKNSGDKNGIADSLNNIGIAYAVLGNYQKALEYFRESLTISKEIGHKKGIAQSLQNVGNIHYHTGNYDMALEFHMKALEKREELGDEKNIANLLLNIGASYRFLKINDKAVEYFRDALKISKKNGSKKGISVALNGIGASYADQNNYDKALEYFLESLKVKEEIGNKRHIATALSNIGDAYEKMGDYHQALEYFQGGLKIRKEIGDKDGIAYSLATIGWIYTKLEKFDEAFLYLSEGLNLSKEIKAKRRIEYSYYCFYDYYQDKRNYKKALEYYKLYSEVRDTILNEDIREKAERMQIQYDTLKNEKKIEALTKDNEIQKLRLSRQEFTRNAFIAGFILVSIILVLLFRKYLYLFSFWKKQKYIGQFRLVEEIGSGGMGVIYKAHGIRDKTDTAAVKVLKPELFKDETGRKRFIQEAAIIDKLDHPNIVKIIQRGQYKDKLFIAMELLQGKTLDVKIDEEGQVDLKECFHIMIQVSDALVLIHDKDIIHRDLKPSNIMLIRRDRDPNFVKLLDFGIAKMKFQTSITRTGILVGSINYMSPEQLANSEFSSASDVYSLGVTFYQMITGRIVFPGDTANEITRQVLDISPIEPNRFRPGIPGDLSDLIMKMLDKDKGSRPSIKEVFETLRLIQAKCN